MGVYIKGMKKPSDCQYCVMYRDGYCGAKGGFCRSEKGIDDDCPLIEVKEPHGDLIDRSSLFKWYEGQRTKYPVKKETPQYETIMMYEVFDEIDDAEAVIEAEVE